MPSEAQQSNGKVRQRGAQSRTARASRSKVRQRYSRDVLSVAMAALRPVQRGTVPQRQGEEWHGTEWRSNSGAWPYSAG